MPPGVWWFGAQPPQDSVHSHCCGSTTQRGCERHIKGWWKGCNTMILHYELDVHVQCVCRRAENSDLSPCVALGAFQHLTAGSQTKNKPNILRSRETSSQNKTSLSLIATSQTVVWNQRCSAGVRRGLNMNFRSSLVLGGECFQTPDERSTDLTLLSLKHLSERLEHYYSSSVRFPSSASKHIETFVCPGESRRCSAAFGP